MISIRHIFKTGVGPSSSHTMGPARAAAIFKEEYPNATDFKVVLFGSLSKTGVGHGTDSVIVETFSPLPCHVEFDYTTEDLPHENTMDLYAYADGHELGYMRVLSVGGGNIRIEGRPEAEPQHVYTENTFKEIRDICINEDIRLSDYVERCEGPEIRTFLLDVWHTMQEEIARGLSATGRLPGPLNVGRKAKDLIRQRHIDESTETEQNRLVCAYAFAAAEENACNQIIVTAPTCGACAVVPAVLKYMQDKKNFSDEDIIRALEVAGLIGALVVTNASISGAECGCQAEIGTACSMASAALCELFWMDLNQIEYAAEMAFEHYLGLTCDPVCGLVQIPCIERNAVAAMRSINALSLANFLSGTRKISFDMVVKTMYETGKDMHSKYRETSEGGLAKHF